MQKKAPAEELEIAACMPFIDRCPSLAASATAALSAPASAAWHAKNAPRPHA